MRHERELIRLPVPICPAGELPEDTSRKMKYLWYAAQLERFEDEEILGVTVFDRKRKPLRRWWMNADRSVMQSFEVVKNSYNHNVNREPERIYETCIDTELDIGGWWRSVETVLVGTGRDDRTVLQFVGAPGAKDIGKALAKFQDRQRTRRREAAQEQRKARARERFAALPAEPETFDKWIEDVALLKDRWFVYEYTGKKAQTGVCTYCQKWSVLEGVRMGAEVCCPHCGSVLTCRSKKRIGSRGLDERDIVALYQKAGEEIAVRVYTVGVHVTVEEMPLRTKKKIWKSEEYRYFLTPDAGHLSGTYSSHYGRYSICVDGFNECGDGYGYARVLICPIGLGEIRRELGLYAPVEELAGKRLRCEPEKIFAKLKKMPEIEYLLKMGLYRLANWEMGVNRYLSRRSALLQGKTVTEKLGVDKGVLRELRQVDPNGETLQVIRRLIRCGVTVRLEDMKDIQRLGVSDSHAKSLHQMLDHLSLHKALRYIGQQVNAGTDADHVLTLWRDYVGMAKELGIDLHDGMRLFPRKLRRAHDEAVKLVEMRKNEKIDKEISQTADSLADLIWETKTLMIFPARSAGELFLEGKTLNHCVGREHYANSMAEGRTAIFFIRKVKEPDVPYVTLELDLEEWRKKQCYGNGDSWPGKTVDGFVREWIRRVVLPARVNKKEAETA